MWASEPAVSIITPCLNAARFVETAIESVLSQDYARIEYIIMDGGSTDGTLQILKRYEDRVTLVSGRDGGAADAIRRGFELSSGNILGWLNADDAYLPGAISAAVRGFESHPDAAVIYGGATWIDQSGESIAPYPVRDFDRSLLARECFVCQPASFFRRDAFENVGGIDPGLHLTFDYELWIRLARTYRFQRIDRDLALSRMHAANKTLGQRRETFRETFRVLRRHYGYVPFPWIYGYLCYLADGRDQFFQPLEPSLLRYLESLPAGLLWNRSAMGRYLAEWSGVMSWAGLSRRLRN
jgi:glycosyltransferase involved in cell wall biosynthesis